MFNSYEFSFAGESSLMYGLMIYDIDGNGQENVSFGNTADIIETRTLNRIQPIHFGVNYHDSPLQFKLVFGAEDYLDRYELENISFWLTGHQHISGSRLTSQIWSGFNLSALLQSSLPYPLDGCRLHLRQQLCVTALMHMGINLTSNTGLLEQRTYCSVTKAPCESCWSQYWPLCLLPEQRNFAL